MDLKIINKNFSICKLKHVNSELLKKEFTFLAKTDTEISLICETCYVPDDTISVEHDWACFRIAEDAAFEKYGMIAFLARIIAEEKTGILVVATYDTDYILIKQNKWEDVKNALVKEGCKFI